MCSLKYRISYRKLIEKKRIKNKEINYLYFIYEEATLINLGTWFTIGNLGIKYGLLLDSLSLSVMVPVGIVTLCLLFYAVEY